MYAVYLLAVSLYWGQVMRMLLSESMSSSVAASTRKVTLFLLNMRIYN